MSLSPEIIAQLTAYKDAGDVASYYSTLAANGHDYGNIAYEAATDTGFWGQYANNFLENKASEYGVSLDRNALMRDLMEADFNARSGNYWEPIVADDIASYHKTVFAENGLPPAAWTGTFLDNRMGPAAWCMRCNGLEREGQTWQDAVTQLLNNFSKDWSGTASEASEFLDDMFFDGVLSETLADLTVDITGSVKWGGVVKALVQALISVNQPGYMNYMIMASIINDFFNAAWGWIQPRSDPLTLDLDGDGLETVGIDLSNPILFNHDGDGIKTGTGWVKPDDGFLVLDRNGNDLIDSGRELFGDATLLEGGGVAADGFAALAQEDTNADGRVDALDARFGQLRIWRDLNQNGISEAGELSTLEAAGIVAIRTG